jgi:hypothetical protein
MRTVWVPITVMGLLSGLATGCGPKVDCDKLGKRLNTCTETLMFTLRPDAKQRMDKVKLADREAQKQNAELLKKDIQRNQITLKEQVTDQCKAKGGRAADAKLINGCLEKSGCAKFASCFGSYLKEKNK